VILSVDSGVIVFFVFFGFGLVVLFGVFDRTTVPETQPGPGLATASGLVGSPELNREQVPLKDVGMHRNMSVRWIDKLRPGLKATPDSKRQACKSHFPFNLGGLLTVRSSCETKRQTN
jgi:hypothetical protein